MIVCYNLGFFDVTTKAARLQVPKRYVESSCFSFCHLYRCLFLSLSKLQTISADVSTWAMQAESVVFQVPTWLTQDSDAYSLSLSSLSVSQLRDVTRSLHLSHFRRKDDFVLALVEDFFQQRILFWDRAVHCNQPWLLSASLFFPLDMVIPSLTLFEIFVL
jgi:hypothetical protein